MNKETAEEMFNRNAVLISGKNVIPERIAIKLTSKKAVEFAEKTVVKGFNGYGIGEIGTMMYLTKSCFFTAVTYQNVVEELKKQE